MKRSLVAAGFFMLALGGICATGCSEEFTLSSRHGGPLGNSGQVGLQLDVGATNVTSVNYIIGNGTRTYRGTVDVGDASTLLAVIGGIEAGTGYVLTLNATGAGGVPCSGASAPFTVVNNATIIVGIALVCSPASNAGSAKIEGTIASCAIFSSVSADVPIGNQIQLSVATLPTSSTPPVSLSWVITNGSGTLSSTSAPNPVYTCSPFDEQVDFNLTLTQSGAPSCTSMFHLIIDCPPADETAADGG